VYDARDPERVCTLLLARGADVNATDSGGHTPLDYTRSPTVFAVLTRSGARAGRPLKPVVLDRVDNDITFERSPDRPHLGPSRLHNACVDRDVQTVWVELRRGVDVNSRDHLGFMPLQIAAYGTLKYEDPELCEMLLKHGADVNATDAHGRTPLDLARARHHDKTVALLERHGGKMAAERPTANR
jgi:ankyrin repeat protein